MEGSGKRFDREVEPDDERRVDFDHVAIELSPVEYPPGSVEEERHVGRGGSV